MRCFSYLVVGVVVALAGVREAGAGQGASPEDPAKAALEEASRAEASNRPSDAIEALKRAYELNGDTALLFRLGELTRQTGQNVPAMRFYRAYLTRDPRGKFRSAAERQVRLLEGAAGDPDAPPGGAAPSAPTPKPAAAGAASSPNERRAGPETSPGISVPVSLTVETTPPPAPQVDLRRDAAPVASGEVAPPLPRWLPWVGVAASVALGTGAALSGLAASHRYDQLRSSCGATAAGCSGADIDDVRSRARTTNLLWAGTGVVAAATGVAIYVNTREAGLSGLWRF